MFTLEARPERTVMIAVTAHSVKAPAPRPARAWSWHLAGWSGRVSRRSQRPLSSSPRSSLVLVSSPHTAPRIMRVMEILKTVKPLTVWSWGAGPKRALIALFEP